LKEINFSKEMGHEFHELAQIHQLNRSCFLEPQIFTQENQIKPLLAGGVVLVFGLAKL
jgi:hypothetical protein